MEKMSKVFNKKLALTILVPVLILAVTTGLIGVSFAWFTEAEEIKIATLHLSTAETFTMDFELNGETQIYDTDNNLRYIYEGQTAFDNDGLLVSTVHAEEIKNFATDHQYTTYMNDRAFVAPFSLRMDTKGCAVSFVCKISNVSVESTTGTSSANIYLPGDNGTPENVEDDLTEEDIKLGFTWYISSGNTWYTPYGTITGTAPTTSPDDPNDPPIPSINIGDEDWDNAPIENTNFVAAAENEDTYNYTFNIVFCPEKLFWQQYGPTSVYNKTAEDIYGDSTVDGGFKSDKWNSINKYSSIVYSGSSYKFTVVLTVLTVTEGV